MFQPPHLKEAVPAEAVSREALFTDPPTAKTTWVSDRARKVLHSHLRDLQGGQLVIREGHRRTIFGRLLKPSDIAAEIHVRDGRFFSSILLSGSLGAAEAYLDGWWDSPHLTPVIRLMARNRRAAGRLEGGLVAVRRMLNKMTHFLRTNTRLGSRRNIEAHYDLGNELFERFLDDSMTYSSALFPTPEATLEEAQEAKLDALCRKLQLRPQDHVLEIGTGWGSFALHAASRYGCLVTTTTISPSQHREALRRVEEAGLEDRITLLQRDYRDLSGNFDKIVSIEMIEAVGHRYFDTFFSTCDRLLKPGGLMALQAITIADRNYESAKHSVDFIQRYIFPGGALPSTAALCSSIARASSLTPVHLEEIGLHYAETLLRWRRRFEANWREISRFGYSERFRRLWRFYFCYCEGGFRERVISDIQLILAGPSFRDETIRGTLP
ncbi:MAG: cyclopropane-fatty-acyl-phospholipid synthase family protein [Deltaproteobacteria bacterium]|nr:cyclopropane-fatty-acyl-phospholipid synthase family protein [Deltaproteobacteria bacterium]